MHTEDDNSGVPHFVYRTYPDKQTQANLVFKEVLDHPIGLAMLAWNSRVGVPADVWYLIFSALKLCICCKLVRSIPSYDVHFDDKGACIDVGGASGRIVN